MNMSWIIGVASSFSAAAIAFLFRGGTTSSGGDESQIYVEVDEFELEAREEVAYCQHPFTDVGVLWNGDVTLCCLDHDGQLKVGNINTSSIEEIITSAQAKKLRGSMLGYHPLPSICQTCQSKPIKKIL